MKHLWRICAVALLISTLPARGEDLRVDFVGAKTYPSLTVIPIIRVHIADSDTLGPNPDHWRAIGFDPSSISSYRVTLGQNNKVVSIRSIHFARMVDSGKPDYTTAYLDLNPAIHANDSLLVTILNKSGSPIPDAQATVTVDADFRPFTFNLTPTSAPSETLTDGATRDVGQLKVDLQKPDLFKWKQARTYIESSDLFSTDGKDTNSKLQGTFGLERNLISSWFVPAHIESQVQGNQTASNLSYLAGLGLKTILPWRHTKPALYNAGIQVPVSPVLTIDAQYERRINQDADSLQKFPNKNSFRLNPTIGLSPIRLLPGLTPDLLDAEVNLRAWYLPFDQTSAQGGKQRLEGASDVSLIIPLSKLNFLGKGLTFMSTGDAAKTQIRIKYSAGANEANGFKHSTSLTYGVEVSP